MLFGDLIDRIIFEQKYGDPSRPIASGSVLTRTPVVEPVGGKRTQLVIEFQSALRQ
jgi:hypothetical protein